MAITVTVAALASAIRLGDSAEETAEATRLLGFATEAISRYLGDAYDDAPESVVNEAGIRLCGFLYDQPYAARGEGFANALRFSGAANILAPYRIHRAGSTGEDDESTPAGSTDDAATSAALAALAARVAALEAAGPAADQEARGAAAAAIAAANANAAAIAALPGPYVLPAAAPGVRGGVTAITNDIIDDGSSTGIFGWALSHVRRVINLVVPAWARDESTSIPRTKLPRTVAGAAGMLDGWAGASDLQRAALFEATDPARTRAAPDGAWFEVVVQNTRATPGRLAVALPLQATGISRVEVTDSLGQRAVHAQTFAGVDRVYLWEGGPYEIWETSQDITLPAGEVTLRFTLDGLLVEQPAQAGGGGAGAWDWAAFANIRSGAAAGVAIAASQRPYPTAGFADYAALRAAILDGSIPQVALTVSQNDQGDGDNDFANFILPNDTDLSLAPAGQFILFPGWALGIDPIKLTVIFGSAGITVTPDAAYTGPLLQVRIGVYA